MKTILALILLALPLFADRAVSITWDAQPEATSFEVSVDGTLRATVQANEALAVPIPEGRTVLSVVACNDGGKSLPASITIPAAPANPKGVTIKTIIRTTVSAP